MRIGAAARELMNLRVEPATAGDIPAIVAIERTPGFEDVVGRWTESEHAAALHSAAYKYFVARRHEQTIGFAIFHDWDAANHVTLLKRIAVSAPGLGYGKAFLARLIDIVFAETRVWRLWLDVFPENERAKRAYEGVGFKAEGIARGAAYFRGEHRDVVIMSLVRAEWLLQRR
jgi:RimJ/RimL family protein N-acetyltransferase